MVDGMNEGVKYQFRVRAKNILGLGASIQTTQPILAQDDLSAPDVDLRSTYMGSVTEKSGNSICVKLPLKGNIIVIKKLKLHSFILGKPRPSAFWTYKDEKLKETQRINSSSDSEFTVLKINKCIREDAGIYNVTVTNSSGQKTIPIKVRQEEINIK